jgi:type I site-specific restriction endonuclease
VTDSNEADLAREAKARIKIDRQLEAAGWVVQHADQANLRDARDKLSRRRFRRRSASGVKRAI